MLILGEINIYLLFVDSPLAITDDSMREEPKQISMIEQKSNDGTVRALLPSRANLITKPKWHAPWKLYRVISGHTGWVRAVDVEPNNEWFVTGGADRIVKVLLDQIKKLFA